MIAIPFALLLLALALALYANTLHNRHGKRQRDRIARLTLANTSLQAKVEHLEGDIRRKDNALRVAAVKQAEADKMIWPDFIGVK